MSLGQCPGQPQYHGRLPSHTHIYNSSYHIYAYTTVTLTTWLVWQLLKCYSSTYVLHAHMWHVRYLHIECEILVCSIRRTHRLCSSCSQALAILLVSCTAALIYIVLGKFYAQCQLVLHYQVVYYIATYVYIISIIVSLLGYWMNFIPK